MSRVEGRGGGGVTLPEMKGMGHKSAADDTGRSALKPDGKFQDKNLGHTASNKPYY